MQSVYDNLSNIFRSVYNRRIRTPAVLDKDRYFPGHRKFTDNWLAIRTECLQVMQNLQAVPEFHQLMHAQAPLSEYGGRYWRVFVLKAYGVAHQANQAKCPVTADLIGANPAIQSATFSFLEGGKHLPAHRGPFRGVLRYHLGLVIAKDMHGASSNRFRINGKYYSLVEGDGLLWDDTFEHEVWNTAPSVRAALLIDVLRPEMPRTLHYLTRLIIFLVALSIRLRGTLREVPVELHTGRSSVP
ncbi:MAG: aspartyl/asparaginyl beta-hydroxylase domain-containing protein [Gammaproteobacteria bacterium]